MRRRFWGSTAGLAAALAITAIAACGGGGEPSSDARLRVYLSVPKAGPDAAQGERIAAGARRALAAAGGEAGGVEVRLVALDAGGSRRRRYDPVTVAANARNAAEDSTAIAYLGELDSAATRSSLPITNAAGILQLSPSADDPELVAEFEGSDELPIDVQASGERTFGTLAPLAPRGSPEQLGGEVMALTLDSIDRAADPTQREDVVAAFLATADRRSPLGTYSIDEIGQAEPERGTGAR